MPLINADIRDSAGQPLVGYIVITLDYWITNESNNDTFLQAPATITLSGGLASFTLEASDVARVTYLFQVFQGTAPDGELVGEFRAMVPTSATPINFTELAQQTGVTRDSQDSAILTIVRRLYSSQDFWASLQQNLFRPRDNFSISAFYRRGDIVTWNGSSYMCKAASQITGIDPSDSNNWQLIASIGATGSGTTGVNAAYDPVAWNGSSQAVSQDSLRDIIETSPGLIKATAGLAPLSGATLLNASVGDTLGAGDRTQRLAYSSWVQDLLDVVRNAIVPVGAVTAWAGTSAPSRWLLCDGRAISRTVYSALFAILGTAYGSGDGSTTFNLPDLRGRVPVGLDQMSALMGGANRVTALTSLGLSGGSQAVSLSAANLPAHTHPLNQASYFTAPGSGGTFNVTTSAGSNHTTTTGTSTGNNSGTGTPHENMPPYLGLNYIIYTGV